MSMDLNPVPGLPLLNTLYCSVTTVLKKKTIKCQYPDILYTKKGFYGDVETVGVGAFEIILIAIFFFLSFKMKHDITKYFLFAVYLPLGISTVFKVACGVYGVMMGAYGFFFMTFLMFFNVFYNTAVVSAAIGSIFYLTGNIIVARRRTILDKGQMWGTYLCILLVSFLLSAAYNFIAWQWNQLPAAALFFTYILSTIGIVALLIASLISGLACTNAKNKKEAITWTEPVVIDARTRLFYGMLFVIVANISQWFELYYKIVELFTPYLWTGNAQKKAFYTAQSQQLMFFDCVRLFMSLPMLIAMFLNGSIHHSIYAWIHHSSTKVKKNQKIFIATNQKVPLLAETDKKPEHEKHKEHIEKTKKQEAEKGSLIVPSTVTQPPPPPPPPQHQNAIVPAHLIQQGHPATFETPPQYPALQYPMAGMSFAPGMVQFPQNMQTTIVYSPPVGQYQNSAGVTIEELK